VHFPMCPLGSGDLDLRPSTGFQRLPMIGRPARAESRSARSLV
jgi:hypothetical protein